MTRLPFAKRPLLLGVVHLRPLPGSPRFSGERGEVRDAASRDAAALLEGGMDGFVVENFGDAPFHPGSVEAVTIAEMARIAADLRRAAGPSAVIGVNVLRNDAVGALAVAAASDADLIRINVHTGAMLTDQGWIAGSAAETLRRRGAWDVPVAIAADVGVKHALRPPGFDIVESARETVGRGLADALIITGVATGAPVDAGELEQVRQALPSVPLIAGSGVDPQSVEGVLARADGVIVGSALEAGGVAGSPVEPERVRRFVDAARR